MLTVAVATVENKTCFRRIWKIFLALVESESKRLVAKQIVSFSFLSFYFIFSVVVRGSQS